MSDLDSEVVAIAAGGAFASVLTAEGSVYIVGYSIDDPGLCMDKGETVISPTLLGRWRKIYSTADSEKFNFLYAGLNYLVAGHVGSLTSAKLLLWGKSPAKDRKEVII